MMPSTMNMANEDEISFPSATILLCEEGIFAQTYHNDGVFIPYNDPEDYRNGGYNGDFTADWHFGRSSVIMADFHVQTLLQQEVIPYPNGVKAGGPYPRFFHTFQLRRDKQ